MSEREMEALFGRLIEIYRLNPAVAQKLLKRILAILHDSYAENGYNET